FEAVEGAIAGLPVEGIEVRAAKTMRGALACTKFEVLVHGEREGPPGHDHGHEHHDHGDEGHHHDHDEPHHGHGDGPDPAPGAQRGLPELRDILKRAKLPKPVRATALRIFERLAEAEARVHGKDAESVKFHEVGALDALADVVGAAAALDALGIREVHCGPIRTGSGMVRIAHGRVPVPAPGTLQCLLGFDLRLEEGAGELVTPTGAAILAAIATPGAPGEFYPERVGYGAGTRDGGEVPNCLRATVGRTPDPAEEPAVWELATNLDDQPPQVLARAVEALLEAGAVDAWTEPAGMKKGRAGVVLRALADEAAIPRVEEAIFAETGTLGVRRHRVERSKCEREWVPVKTPFGKVRVKVGTRGGEVVSAAPEYEDCRAAADEAGVPVRKVMEAARAAWNRVGPHGRLSLGRGRPGNR
ncbi:MAG TPA: nickel pincer cofactor biosynthesis protein LarC, partial [Planctomycetota bacterium]|nr:nickel pincer cofactor biosynthesis protein LarC [Planctomycetota bacterium]